MKQSNIYKYYSFGYNFNNLTNRPEGHTFSGYAEDLKLFFREIEYLALPVTTSGIELNGLDKDYEKIKKAIDEGKGDEKISKTLHASIQSKLKKLDNILDAELSILKGFIIENKRYSIEILTAKIEKLFSANTFDKLPSIAQFDFKECGMCLALDRYTASAYHILRGIEDVLKFYYSTLTTIAPTTSDTWFKFTQGIEDGINNGTINPAPAEELRMNLDNLRKFYRNKTQHPDKIYTEDEVQDLLGIGVKTVNEIITDLSDRSLI